MEPSLDSVRATEPSTRGRRTVSRYNEETRSLENEELRQSIENLVQDREQRKAYGDRLFVLVKVWLGMIALIVLMHGCRYLPFELSTTVLATLIGSTTASVLGLFAIVANYLFPKR